MGVPKFFRWISERYPCLSVSVDNNQIPDFDCLYLDMNGIIHICSHPDDANVQFRINELDIFNNVFNYIEFLFKIVKPKDVFFLAVDGVAPRAKMNQQRARRFKSAKEAINREIAAIQSGVVIPDEKRFDSNAITPGTEFMDRLQKALVSFLENKIQTDSLWQGVDVILSGHETPGEGEHKIQEFIRYRRSLPDYNPNTRHCLYGLDADLMILGLASHEPYFSLLREEVTFSRKKTKRAYIAEETKFFLLHLSLLREYIDYEFNALKEMLIEEYSLERIIDDWIIMSFLIGNDFVPHLPNLHIHTCALPFLWETYIKVRPTLDGYINDCGKLHLNNFLKYVDALSIFDRNNFFDNYEDMQWMLGKTGEKLGKELDNLNNQKHAANNNQLDLDVSLCNIFDESQLVDRQTDSIAEITKRIINLDDGIPDSPEINVLTNNLEQEESIFKSFSSIPNENSEVNNEENSFGVQLESMNIEKDLIEFAFEENDNIWNEERKTIEEQPKFSFNNNTGDEEFWNLQYRTYKRDYYLSKLGLNLTDEVLIQQANEYVTALQWISFYYFCGVPSWSWFYPQHYAPFISDLSNLSSDLKDNGIDFEIGRPFLPFEQLMAVLPADSSELLPSCYHSLMTEENSPIIDFYPKKFRTDLNGKKKEWEAVVLIPFIDEKRLLEAMESKKKQISTVDIQRNVHGPHIKFRFSNSNLVVSEIAPEIFRIPMSSIVPGLCPMVRLDVICQGFPTFRHVDHSFQLEKVGVKIFEFTANGSSIVLRISPQNDLVLCPEEIAQRYINEVAFVNWPAFIEVKVIAVLDETHRYTLNPKTNSVVKQSLSETDNLRMTEFKSFTPRNIYRRNAISIDPTNFLVLETVHSNGKIYEIVNTHKAGSTIRLEHDWNSNETFWHLQQLSVLKKSIDYFDSNSTKVCSKLNQLFPKNATVFSLSKKNYGRKGIVEAINNCSASIKIVLDEINEPIIPNLKTNEVDYEYMNAGQATEYIEMNPLAFSRITGTIYINLSAGSNSLSAEDQKPKRNDRNKATQCSIGLDLKNNKLNLQIPGWVIKGKCENAANKWLYSRKVIDIVNDYRNRFPEVFEFIKKPNFEKLTMDDIFNKDVQQQKIIELQQYLSNLPYKNLERISNDCQIISESDIALIEQSLNSVQAAFCEKSCRVELVFRELYTPHHSLHGVTPDKSAVFQLMDRVVCSTDGYTVPLGLRGVVIGIEQKKVDGIYLEVLFDKPFKSAISIRGSECRCYRMPPYTLINITFGTRKFNKTIPKESKKDDCVTEVSPSVVNLSSQYESQNRTVISSTQSPYSLNNFPLKSQHSKTPKSPKIVEQQKSIKSSSGFPSPMPSNDFLDTSVNKQKNFIAHCNQMFVQESHPEMVYTVFNCIPDYRDFFIFCLENGITEPAVIENHTNGQFRLMFTSRFISLPEFKDVNIIRARQNLINQVSNQISQWSIPYVNGHYYTPEQFNNNPFLDFSPQLVNSNKHKSRQYHSFASFDKGPSSLLGNNVVGGDLKKENKPNGEKPFITRPKPRNNLFKK